MKPKSEQLSMSDRVIIFAKREGKIRVGISGAVVVKVEGTVIRVAAVPIRVETVARVAQVGIVSALK